VGARWGGMPPAPTGEEELRIYEYDEREIDELLPFRNAIFGHVSRDHWFAMNNTGVVAREGDELVGFIPLQYRQQTLNARVSIPVVYENAVGVAQGRRGQGIGTAMLDEAARFMSDRVDAMMVIRSGERSEGYRFYRKAGHSDLMYACWYYLEPEVEWPAADRNGLSADESGLSADEHGQPVDARGFAVVDEERWLALEPQLLALHERQYGRFGGGRRREPGYWRTVLDGHVYGEHPRWLVTLADEAGRLAGYLVAVQGDWGTEDQVYVYEVVGRDDDAVERLVRYARRLSGDEQLNVPLVSLSNPIRPLLLRLGFAEGESSPHVMARILRPDRIFHRLAEGSGLQDTLALTVLTPHRTLQVNDPPRPRYAVRLETKEGMLTRLCCCRLDLEAALELELVRWRQPDASLRRDLAWVFAPCEWVQWYTDFV
jgi:GNAT superfamily N-acetyltransferase